MSATLTTVRDLIEQLQKFDDSVLVVAPYICDDGALEEGLVNGPTLADILVFEVRSGFLPWRDDQDPELASRAILLTGGDVHTHDDAEEWLNDVEEEVMERRTRGKGA